MRTRSAVSSRRSRPSTACSHRSACRRVSIPKARTSTRSISACSGPMRMAPAVAGQPQAVQARHRQQPAAHARCRQRPGDQHLDGVPHRVRAKFLDPDHAGHLLDVQAARRLYDRGTTPTTTAPTFRMAGSSRRAPRRTCWQPRRARCARAQRVRFVHDADDFDTRERDRGGLLGAASTAEQDRTDQLSQGSRHRRSPTRTSTG